MIDVKFHNRANIDFFRKLSNKKIRKTNLVVNLIFKFQYLILIFWFYFFKDILKTSHFKQPQEPQNRKKNKL